MGLPAFEANGYLPLGRHSCTLDEFESAFVLDTRFEESGSRQAIFADFLAALAALDEWFGEGLVERVWIGGGFTTEKLDPSDIDVTFVLDEKAHDALSGTKRDKLEKILRTGGFKKLDLSVDGFMMVRTKVANPWKGSGVTSEATPYLSRRGGWDDWWSRDRVHGDKGQPALIEDAEPVRGYVEVTI